MLLMVVVMASSAATGRVERLVIGLAIVETDTDKQGRIDHFLMLLLVLLLLQVVVVVVLLLLLDTSRRTGAGHHFTQRLHRVAQRAVPS